MSKNRTHYVTSADDVIIGGSVHGQGKPLVFLQGIMGDGDLDWAPLLPHLEDRFTCHLPSMRGRGLSGDHPDLSFGRLIDDFLTYVDSLGEPAGLVGWSAGAGWALAMAAQSGAVNAVAALEPVVNMDARELAAFGEALARTGELAHEGNLTAAMRAFATWPFSDDDLAAAEETGYFEAARPYVPNLLRTFQQLMEYEGPTADDPAVLAAISAPVLLLHGSASKPLFAAGARHVADHVPNKQIREIPGAGHAAQLTHPEALAEALTAFFAPAREPV